MDIQEFVDICSEIKEAIKWGAFTYADIEKDTPLYHYTSIDGLKGIIESKKFWATEYHFLNDDDEFTYCDGLLQEMLKEEYSSCDFYNPLALCITEAMIGYRFHMETVQDSFYVVSFSKNSDNLTLWSEFAGQGCNIRTKDFQLFADIENIRYQGSVLYNRGEQKQRLWQAMLDVAEGVTSTNIENKRQLKEVIENMSQQEYRSFADVLVHLVSFYGMAMKRPQFAAEEEYRVIFDSKGKDIKYRQKDGLLLPYIELGLQENLEAMQEIKLAPRSCGELSKYSMRSFLAAKGLARCDVSESEMSLKY